VSFEFPIRDVNNINARPSQETVTLDVPGISRRFRTINLDGR
jgi:hypothetical protein